MTETQEQLLIRTLLSFKAEGPCVEYKQNLAEPQRIGKLISALANAAALAGQGEGYVLWGVEDQTRRVVGTSFDPATTREGNQPLEIYLASQLDPAPAIQFFRIEYEQC